MTYSQIVLHHRTNSILVLTSTDDRRVTSKALVLYSLAKCGPLIAVVLSAVQVEDMLSGAWPMLFYIYVCHVLTVWRISSQMPHTIRTHYKKKKKNTIIMIS